MLALCACTTVDAGGKGKSLWFVGITRVTLPDTIGKLSTIDVKTLGAGWDQGPYIGWRSGNWVIADPAECQLLIVIRTPAAAENAAKVLNALKGQQPCIADYTHSSPR